MGRALVLGRAVLVVRATWLLGVVRRRRCQWFSSRPAARPRGRWGLLGSCAGEIRNRGLAGDGLGQSAVAEIFVIRVEVLVFGIVGTRCTVAVPRARPVGRGSIASAVLGHGGLRARGCGPGGVHGLGRLGMGGGGGKMGRRVRHAWQDGVGEGARAGWGLARARRGSCAFLGGAGVGVGVGVGGGQGRAGRVGERWKVLGVAHILRFHGDAKSRGLRTSVPRVGGDGGRSQ